MLIYRTKSSKINFKIKLILRKQDLFRIQNSATPLWNLTYEEQLTKKSTIVQEYLKGLEQKIKEIINKPVEIPFEGIKPSVRTTDFEDEALRERLVFSLLSMGIEINVNSQLEKEIITKVDKKKESTFHQKKTFFLEKIVGFRYGKTTRVDS